MLYLKRGAAAQVIAAKNSTPARFRKHFLNSGGAKMPFFSVFAHQGRSGATCRRTPERYKPGARRGSQASICDAESPLSTCFVTALWHFAPLAQRPAAL